MGPEGDETVFDFVSKDGSLKKKIVVEGSQVGHPALGSLCEISASGSIFVDGSLLDIVGNHEVVIGKGETDLDCVLESCVSTMRKHETSIFTLLGGNLKISLHNFTKGKQLHEYTDTELMEKVNVLKEEGKALFASEMYLKAFRKYSFAFKCLCCMESYKEHTILVRDLQNNMAACQLKVGNYQNVVSLCSRVLDSEQMNMKAMYRRGLAHFHLGNVEDAIRDLTKCVRKDPGNVEAKRWLKKAEAFISPGEALLGKGAIKMFGTGGDRS